MKLHNINKIYHNQNNDIHALKNINLELNNNGITMILGPSGCGKTTLLNIMSGEEKNFEGELNSAGNICYLTQDVELFESMTVYENLIVVNSNRTLVEEYLKKYDMWEHRNKKVKKCSGGQKKRVQFLRALLQEPAILLCDEPTASLDHDNKEALMMDLKEVSKNIQVIIVTHDIAVATKYADRIIRIGKGKIESDEVIHQTTPMESKNTKKKKSLKEMIQLIWYELKSRKVENLLYVLILVLGITSIFSTFDLYSTIEKQTSAFETYKKAENIIMSYPKNPKTQIEYLTWGGTKYGTKEEVIKWEYIDGDIFYYKDIQKVIKTYPEIVAVEAFYDDMFEFRSTQQTEIIQNQTERSFKVSNLPIFLKYIEEADLKRYSHQHPLNTAFFINDNLYDKVLQYREAIKRQKGSNNLWFEEYEYLDFDIEEYESGFSFFDLVNNHKLPLMYGNMPKSNEEIVISKDTAEFLLEYLNVNNLENLLEKKIRVGMDYNLPSLFSYLPGESGGYCYDDEEAMPLQIINLKISGITSIENDYMNMVFFDSGFGKNAILDYFVEDYNSLYFDYVRFVIDPEVDRDVFLEKINKSFVNDMSQFYFYTDAKMGKVSQPAFYRDVSNLMFFAISIMLILFISIVLYHFFIKKRNVKEQKLLKEYGYSIALEKGLRVFFNNLLSFVVIMVSGSFLVNWINRMANVYRYERFLSFDIKFVMIGVLIVFVFNYLCEMIICRKK